VVVKRVIDVGVSALGLVALLPLIALIALLVRIESPGPTLIRCERVGWGGRKLRMLKFRKMHNCAGGAALTLERDERFTRVGRWLAKLKLDEIPQLWHVLIGEMSLVGPRPESEMFVSLFRHDYDVILATRPGIIGLSQIAFVCEGRVLDHADPIGDYVERILPQKIAMDRLYVEQPSAVLDLRIFLWAIVAVLLRRQVAVDRVTGRLSLRQRRAR
jgi:lipopolysaccharide/colanic/teichoic acid biosynthesis glycosyltransferase